jgi:formylmethanofuran dehydrogenase subunit C
MITLTPLREFRFPVIAECINPDVFENKSVEEIALLTVWEGNKKKNLAELFKIEKKAEDTGKITIHGDIKQVRRIGTGMKNGEIVVNGSVGMHVGEKMSGGKIAIQGDAEGWAGSDMKKGLIEIMGNAGPYLASPYRGSSAGMRGGKIIVHGNVDTDVAVSMKGGIIKIKGNAGPFLGFRMSGGTVHIEKKCGKRVGACMTGGRITVSGVLEEVLPSFTIEGTKAKVRIEEGDSAIGPFYTFLGDLAEDGNGKLFVSKSNNPHLSKYERFL